MSLYPAMAGKGKLRDPRPIKDATYQRTQIRILLKYLLDSGYGHPITMKQLRRPSAREFANIAYFLFSKADRGFRPTSDFKKDVPKFLKGIRYPVTFSSTALAAVGSPNTWPNMLAALTWLTELLLYKEFVRGSGDAAAAASASGVEDPLAEEDNKEKLYYEHLRPMYTALMSGDEALSKQLQIEEEEKVASRNFDLERRIEQLRRKLEALTQELARMKEQHPRVDEMQQVIDVLASDSHKLDAFIKELGSHKESHRHKIEKQLQLAHQRQADLSAARAEQKRLQAIVSGQELRSEDVADMQTQHARLRREQEICEEQRTTTNKCLWEMEMSRSTQLEELDAVLKRYGDAVFEMQMVPITAKYARGTEFDVQRNHYEMDGGPLLSVNVKEDVKPALRQMISSAVTSASSQRAAANKLQEATDALDEKLLHLDAKTSAATARLKKEETQLKRQRQMRERSDGQLQSEIAEARRRIAQLRSDDAATRQAVTHTTRAVAEMAAAQATLQTQRTDELSALGADVLHAVTTATDLKEHVQVQLLELEAVVAAKEKIVASVQMSHRARATDAEDRSAH